MNAWEEPLRAECTSLVDFLKCMYDILEAHRWAITERNFVHGAISHANILVLAKDAEKNEKQKNEFTGKYRPIFVNEIIDNKANADPMARLGDLDDAAEPSRERAVSRTFVSMIRMNDDPLRCRTGTPKFIARSPAAGCLLLNERWFHPMPALPADLTATYIKAYPHDRSQLRAFRDTDETYHGGVFHDRRANKKYNDNPRLASTEFQHRPRHDAESVFWCMVAFVLGAVPLGSPPEDAHDAHRIKRNDAWWTVTDAYDRRINLLRADEDQWAAWLHPRLRHVGRLLVLLARQVAPEWGLCDPLPHMLHLHEAMQRLILIISLSGRRTARTLSLIRGAAVTPDKSGDRGI